MRPHRTVFLLVGLAGCAPGLTEGLYECVDDESCPSGWSCHVDERCYAEEQLGEVPYAVGCTMDEECSTASCWTGPDELAETSFCSAECSLDSDCPAVEGVGVYCLSGMCTIGCDTTEDCPEPLRCYLPSGPRVSPFPVGFAGACFAIDARELTDDLIDCVSNMEMLCPVPGTCMASPDLDGLCTVRCHDGTECPDGQGCVAAIQDRPMCLRTCTSDTDCEQMRCAAMPGEDTMHCVPPAWFDHGLPVPLTPRMMM